MTENTIAPRVAVAHDLSGLGRCALSVILPTLGVLGVQPCPLPTALLSAHTAFESVTMSDQTAFVARALAEWARLGRAFEGVYTGFLASVREAELLLDFLRAQRACGCRCLIVDPAMADHGVRYRTVPPQMPEAMRALCAVADLITPNHTEACLLTGTVYDDRPLSPSQVGALLRALTGLGCGAALVTGLRLEEGNSANILMRAGEKGYWVCRYDRLPASFPGTGDLFAAVLTGLIVTGVTPHEAMSRATGFVYQAMARTIALGTQTIEGVQFEPMLRDVRALKGLPLQWLPM